MEGARFLRVITRRANLRYAFPPDFAGRLEGQTVHSLTRRAKYLVAQLSSGERLVMHLGMSGWFMVGPPRGGPHVPGKHDHVIFEMSSGRTVVFNDPRRFGFMKIIDAAPADADWTGGSIGPEPLDRTFTPQVLGRALRGKKTTLKAALLDQRVVAGLGNIYVCEALHRARLSPKRGAGRLKPASTIDLVDAIKDTLRDAIRHRHRPEGADRFLVYDREGARCPRRRCPGTIRRIVQGGRSTFYCPVCQR